MSERSLTQARAAKMLARIDYQPADTLLFVRPDGELDTCAAGSDRARALMAGANAFRVVGTYRRGVALRDLLADIRAVAS